MKGWSWGWSWQRKAAACVFLAGVGVAACSSLPDGKKLLGEPGKGRHGVSANGDGADEPFDEDAEAERLRKLQLVRLIVDNKDESIKVDELAEDHIVPYCLQNLQALACADHALALAYDPNLTPSSAAAARYATLTQSCVATTALCIARTLMAAALPQAGGLDLSAAWFGAGESVKLPEQTTATQAAFAVESIQYAQQGLVEAFPALSKMATEDYPFEWTFGSQTYQQLAIDTFTGLYHTALRASELAVGHIVTVADTQLGDTSLDRALKRAIGGAKLSRAEAAHLLVGGAPGIRGVVGGTFCQQQVHPDTQAALDIIRAAGPPPPLVLSSGTNLQEFLNTGSDSVRIRLMALNPGLALPSNIEDYYGLKPQSFAGARKYLTQEISTFDSPRFDVLPGTVAGAPPRFVGTALPPRSVAGFFATVARRAFASGLGMPLPYYFYYDTGGDTNALPPDPFDVPWGPFNRSARLPLAYFLDIAQAYAKTLARELSETRPDMSDTERQTLVAPLQLVTSSQPVLGRVSVKHKNGGKFSVRIDGFDRNDGIVLVFDTAALLCAVSGTVGGADCSLVPSVSENPDGTGKIAVPVQTSTPPADGFDKAVKVDDAHTPSGVNQLTGQNRMFVLQSRDGSYSPGQFEVLGGVQLDIDGGAQLVVPLIPDLDREVESFFEPSNDWCGRPKTSCLGKRFDARIPLENELLSDADPVESSWRTYLTRARDAADRADQAADEYIAAGTTNLQNEASAEERDEQNARLASDRAREAAEICGVDIDPRALVEQLQDQAATIKVGKSCSASGFDCLGDDFGCHGGVCMPTAAEQIEVLAAGDESDVELQRLNTCLSPSKTSEVPFVSLGTVPLCLWVGDGEVCSGQLPGVCPALKRDPEVSCAEQFHSDGLLDVPDPPLVLYRRTGTPFFVTPVETVPLGYFEPPAGDSSSNYADACVALAKARAAGPSKAKNYYAEIFKNKWAEKGNLVALRKRMRFRQVPDGNDLTTHPFHGFMVATVDNAVAYATGDTRAGPASDVWPCALTQPDRDSFDLTYSCSNCVDDRVAGPGCPLFCRESNCSVPGSAGRITANGELWMTMQAAAFLGNPKEQDALGSKLVLTTPDGSPENMICSSFLEAIVLTSNDFTPFSPTASDSYQAYDGTRVVQRRFEVSGGISDWQFFDGTEEPFATFTPIQLGWHVDTPFNPDQLNTVDFLKQLLEGTEFRVTLHDEITGRLPTYVVLDRVRFLDAYELLCDIGAKDAGSRPELLSKAPPAIHSASDLIAAKLYMERLVNEVRDAAVSAIFSKLPRDAVDVLRTQSADGVFPGSRGEYADAVSEIRQALLQIRSAGPAFAGQIQGFGTDLGLLGDRLRLAKIQGELANLDFLSTRVSQMTACAQSMIPNVEGFAASFGAAAITQGIGAALTCANSFAQINFAASIASLQKEAAAIDGKVDILSFAGTFNDRGTAIQEAALGMFQGFERLDRALNRLDSLRRRAANSLTDALTIASFSSPAQKALNETLGNVFDLRRKQYKRALKNAQLAAFLAKRAVEQRLGVRLKDIRQSLSLVEAPAKWEADVCSIRAAKFKALKNDDFKAGEFADSYIGDYVTRLENVVESYRLDHPFHEGTDTAVISLRDDLLNVRSECPAESPNLLKSTGRLDDFSTWKLKNCLTEEVEGAKQNLADCFDLRRLDQRTDLRLPASEGRDAERAVLFEFRAGEGSLTTPTTLPSSSSTPGETFDRRRAALVQHVTLEPGRYRFSFYVLRTEIEDPLNGQLTTVLPGFWYGTVAPSPEGSFATGVSTEGPEAAFDELIWVPVNGSNELPHDSEDPEVIHRYFNRFARTFTVFTPDGSPATVELGFTPPWRQVSSSQMNELLQQRPYVIGMPMLERISAAQRDAEENLSTSSDNVVFWRPFIDADKDGLTLAPICEDTDGSVFRRETWDIGAVNSCAGGTPLTCAEGATQSLPFWETSFALSQRSLQDGSVLNYSGFARGNYNYRIESIGLNFVGSNTRTCADADTPSSCYNAGFIPYSIEHSGPFYVRNHDGEDIKALLFNGQIEHARGLATERYLTNPLSSDDAALIDQFLRPEFSGRPLDGRFTVRIWNEPGVNFDAIQDVQLVLKYRYWTKND